MHNRYPEILNVDNSERIQFYQEGKIALYARWTVDINDLFTLDVQWDTPDWLLIGSLVPEGHSGIGISPLNILSVTRYCTKLELARAFIRSVYVASAKGSGVELFRCTGKWSTDYLSLVQFPVFVVLNALHRRARYREVGCVDQSLVFVHPPAVPFRIHHKSDPFFKGVWSIPSTCDLSFGCSTRAGTTAVS